MRAGLCIGSFLSGLAFVSAPTGSFAQAPSCKGLPPQSQYSSQHGLNERCICGPDLKNVALTLHKAFRLRAACGVGWDIDAGRRLVDLSEEKVSFDQYNKDGDLPQGQLLLVGRASLEGFLTYAPGPSGEFWFSHNNAIAREAPLTQLLSGLKLTREHGAGELRMPQHLRRRIEAMSKLGKEICWTAKVTLDVNDIWLTIGGSDEAGAYPSGYTIRKISGHKLCQ